MDGPMTEKRDYYEVLGVPRTATAAEVKKSYRRVAMETHPDRNPGDHKAESRFKQAAEAYEVLSDEDKRARYDRYGHAGLGTAGGGGYSSFESIFEAFGDIFGGFDSVFRAGGGGRSAGRAGANLKVELEIGFLQAARGCEQTITLQRGECCERCDGSGLKPGKQRQPCGRCGGRGEVTRSQGFFAIRSACPSCNGQGAIVTDPCAKCSGSGVEQRRRELQLKIPPGVENGTRMRLGGEGEAGTQGGPSGDLYVFLTVSPHDLFERQDDDIICEVPISFGQAALGARITVPTLEGSEELEIAPGTQSHTIVRLSGKGFPSLRGYGKGDQLVKMVVEVPRQITREQDELIRQLAVLEQKQVCGRRRSFLKRIKEFFDGE